MVARLGWVAVAALFVAASACTPEHEGGLREVDDEEHDLIEQRCDLDGAQASLSGSLVNRSGSARPWAVSVAFRNGEQGLSSATDFSDGAVPDGAEWRWRVEVTVDPERVRPQALGCDVVRVDVGDPVDR